MAVWSNLSNTDIAVAERCKFLKLQQLLTILATLLYVRCPIGKQMYQTSQLPETPAVLAQ